MAGEVTFFGNRATINVKDGAETTALAVIKGWEFTVGFEHIENYGMDSILREGVARVKAKVNVKIKAGKFNPTVASWFLMKVLNPAGADGTLADTNDVALFEIEGEVTTGGTSPTRLKAVVSDCYFESVPFVGSENQWMVWDLSAVGKTIAFSNPTT